MRRVGALMLALGLPASAWPLEFRSVADAAVLYDAPSRQARRLYVMARQTPVEVVVTVEGWTKVRDAGGDIAWIEKRLLSEQRTLIVTAARGEVRSQPDEKAALAFEADKDVVLELVEAAPPGWAKVRHRDGQTGFVRVTQVWGL
jgi:SH3-like domain-containing protein